jgi:hypothetical protein
VQPFVLDGAVSTVSAQHCLDAGGDLPGAERFGHVVIRPHAESDELVDLLGACRDEDDVGVAEGAQLPQHVEPVDAGQHHVQQH